MLSMKLRRKLKTTYKNSTIFDFLFPLKSYQLFGIGDTTMALAIKAIPTLQGR